MISRPLIVLLLVIFLSSPSQHALAKDSPDEVDKRALVIQIEKDITESIQSLEAFQKELRGAKPPEFSVDPDSLIQYSKQHLADLRAFLVLVQKQELKDVPRFLADTFSSCDDRGICAHKLHPNEINGYVVSYGARALDVIQARFDSLAPIRKESALNLFLRIQPLSCPDSVLKRAIGDDVFRVRFSALSVYRGNCPLDDYLKTLNQLLRSEQNPDFLLALLEFAQIKETRDPRNAQIFSTLMSLTQSGRIPLEKGFGMLCSAEMANAPFKAAEFKVGFWVEAFKDYERRRICIAENIFLKVKDKRDLAMMDDIFTSAAEYHYNIGGTQDIYGKAERDKTLSFWAMAPGLDEKVLALSPKVSKLMPSADSVTLHIKILDLNTGVEVAAGHADVKTGVPFNLTVDNINHTGILNFNTQSVHYEITDLRISPLPAAVVFRAIIPYKGQFKANLMANGKTYEWLLSVVPLNAP